MTDLGRLELLVQEQGDHAGEECHRIGADVDERAAGDLQRRRGAAYLSDVGDVLRPDLGLDATVNLVDGLAKLLQPFLLLTLHRRCLASHTWNVERRSGASSAIGTSGPLFTGP